VLPVELRMTFGQEPPPRTANEWVRANVQEAMELRRWNQAELAKRLNRSQPWLSKRLSGTTEFQIGDLDAIAMIFGLSPSELLCAGYGKWDRRTGERRTRPDRRQATRSPFLHREYPKPNRREA
jgi:transcriptional regulator with XRE-family HTH domain